MPNVLGYMPKKGKKKVCPACKKALIAERNPGSLLVLWACTSCNAAFDWYIISPSEKNLDDSLLFKKEIKKKKRNKEKGQKEKVLYVSAKFE
jgi:ribosomal protein L37AE/L43A